MKSLMKLSLIVGVLLVSKITLALNPLSPKDVNQAAVAACEPEDLLFSDNPQACQEAKNECGLHFKQCIHALCGSYEDYYGDLYHNCEESELEACQQQAAQEIDSKVEPACKYTVPEAKKPTIIGTNIRKESLVPVEKVPGPHLNEPPLEQPKLPEPQLPDPKQPEPEQPETDIPADSGTVETPSFVDNKSEVKEIPAVVNAMSGSGCTLNTLAMAQGGFENLIYGLLGLLPILGIGLNRK